MSYIVSVALFAVLCIIFLSIFYIMIKIQEKKFKQYVDNKTLETINKINHTTRDYISIALNIADSEWGHKYGKNK